tara:strand:- start:529 stop:1236 length:708 start_codon:yes stop_codon:yes gene_type:complete
MNLKSFNLVYSLDNINSSNSKVVVSTLNAHSYNVCLKDKEFKKSLIDSDYVLPDGVGITLAMKFLHNKIIHKISGYNFFINQCEYLNKINGSCFFLGSTNVVLEKIKLKMKNNYPNVKVSSYSPPFKKSFTKRENEIMLTKINKESCHTLFVGMTAPKQEKWVLENYKNIDVKLISSIGAVFDFYSGNKKRAPKLLIDLHLEWLHRFFSEPFRLYDRYLIGNFKFIFNILKNELN